MDLHRISRSMLDNISINTYRSGVGGVECMYMIIWRKKNIMPDTLEFRDTFHHSYYFPFLQFSCFFLYSVETSLLIVCSIILYILENAREYIIIKISHTINQIDNKFPFHSVPSSQHPVIRFNFIYFSS